MSVVVIGLSHHQAPLDVLERVAVDAVRLPKVLQDLVARPSIAEAVVLSTCNRTEVYVSAERFHGAFADVRDVFADLAGVPAEAFDPYLSSWFDDGAAEHLFAVAAGLDSVVLGESEILGQVRGAWEDAQGEGACRGALNILFRHAVEVGKRARTETGISRSTASVSHAAVSMASEHLGGLARRRVLVLGAGEMGEGIAVALSSAGVAEIRVANRTFDRAVTLAARVNGRAVHVDDLGGALDDVDLLLTSTAATTVVIDQSDLEGALRRREGRPLLIVDVAVPRDVDPSVAGLDGVTLLDIDDLKAFAAAGVREREREVGAVRALVADEVRRWIDDVTAREVAPLVSALHSRAEAVRVGELERYRSRLDGLDARAREAVEAVTRGIVGKLLHDPTVRLKDVAGTAKGERLAEALRDLFDL